MEKALLKALEDQPHTSLTDVDPYYKGFLYGEYGVGKTTLCGNLVHKKALFIHTDRNFIVLKKVPGALDKIDLMPYTGLSQLEAVAKAIEEQLTVNGKDYSEYDLVVVDTISQVQEEYLDWLYENYDWKGNHREQAMPTTRGLDELSSIGLPDYKVTRDKMRKPIKSLIKAPVDVIFVAHLREPSAMEVAKGKMVRRPTLTEAVFKLIAREVNWMGLMEREKSEIKIQFATDRKTVSKSSIEGLENKTLTADETIKVLNEFKGY